MKTTLRIPGFSPAASQVIAHYLAIFLLAFGAQLVAGATHVVSIPALIALLTSAAAAGVTAVAHVMLGLIPVPQPLPAPVVGTPYNVLGITLKVNTAGYQFLVSVLVTFLSIFGAQLVGGAAGITSLPSVVALILAAITAAVAGIVQFVVGLIPAPK
jgi:hypothetical protein